MKRALATTLAALALGGASPLLAGSVYVPVVKATDSNGSSQTTEIWVSNTGTAQRPFTTTFIAAEADGTKRGGTPAEVRVPPGRLFLINNPAPGGATGLLEIDATPELSVEARLKSVPQGGGTTVYASVPVISSENLLPSGAAATLLGLKRDIQGNHSDLTIVNLGQQATQCEVKLFRADATQIASTTVLAFQPLSLRHFDDALGILREQQATDVRVQVSCNQPFFAYATIFDAANSQNFFVTPSANGSSTLVPPGKKPDNPVTPGAIVYRADGLLHVAERGTETKEFFIPVDRKLELKRFVVDLDFVPGPWNTSKIPGNHALVWIYRGRYRSGTIANVNAFGPGKFAIKMNQNVDMPPGDVTAKEAKLELQQGVQYHLTYTYDAESNRIDFVVSRNGEVVATASMAGTARRNTLTILPTDEVPLNVQFGHNRGQEGPEIPSYGWRYSNLQVQMIPY